MLVDDEPDISFVLKMVLEENGFEAYAYDDSLLALEAFKPRYFDLVILDIKMPGMDGFHLYEEMKNRDKEVKVCFLTASEMYHQNYRKRDDSCHLNKELFIRKPIENEILIQKINKLIASGS